MNKKQVIELIKINLLFANPQATDRARKKGKSGNKLIQSLINQSLLSGIVFLIIYGMTLFILDFSKMPGTFTHYVALFSILAFSQGMTVIYNVFFESQDLPAYLSLPLQQNTIFITKFVVITITVLPFILPLLLVFLLTGWRAGLLLPIFVVVSVILFLLILVIVFSLCSIVIFGVSRTAFFKTHKKMMTTILLGSSMIIAIIGIILVTNQNSTSGDRQPISLLLPIFHIASAPFSAEGLLSFVGIIGMSLLTLMLVKSLIISKLYDQLTETTTSTSINKKRKTNQNLAQILVDYNKQLLKEPSLIIQVLSNAILLPIIVTFSVNGTDFSQLSLQWLSLSFLMGIFLASLTINQTSFIGNLISLDQENFNFVQALPIQIETYMKQKFKIGFFLQATLIQAVALMMGLTLHLPLLFIICLLIGSLLGCYLFCLFFFARDYRLRFLDWTTINQLFNRGIGIFGLLLMILGTFIGSFLILIGYSYLMTIFPTWLLNSSVFTLVALISFSISYHYKKSFWQQFK